MRPSDLINNFHGDLARRITGLHSDVQRIGRNISTLIAQNYPEVAHAIDQRLEQELYSVSIPDPMWGRLEAMFERDGPEQPATLGEMTDCFLVHFESSTWLLPHASYGPRIRPPVSQYLALLKCQFLMNRIKNTTELRNPRRMSHWPGYVSALQEVSAAFDCFLICTHSIPR